MAKIEFKIGEDEKKPKQEGGSWLPILAIILLLLLAWGGMVNEYGFRDEPEDRWYEEVR